MSLSRRDRAAMELALVAVRRWGRTRTTSRETAADQSTRGALAALYEGDAVSLQIARTLYHEFDWVGYRERRARLALILRVLLRVTANIGPDRFGPMRSMADGRSAAKVWIAENSYVTFDTWYAAGGSAKLTRHITPLWEQARRD